MTKPRTGRAKNPAGSRKPPLLKQVLKILGEPEGSPPQHIPWSYGRDRVRAMAIDPERLYVYWEVGDEARERARATLGADAGAAWLNLRVYDSTGRLFDGTNARGYFDHRVEDGSRQWFVEIGKPGSEAFVELGMKSEEGSFVRIARSGRVVFPRRSAAPHREPQWLTVRAGSEAPSITNGEVSTFEVDGRPHLAFGPWEVIVLGPVAVEASEANEEETGSRVLSRWMVYRSWAVERGSELTLEAVGERHWGMLGSSAIFGASERLLRGASELRRAGASELLHRGASERRPGGASERLYGAASERVLRGASGRR